MSYRLTREERLYLQFMFAVMNRLIEVCPSYLADMTNTVTGCVLEAWQMEHGTQSRARLEQLALPAGFALDFVPVRGAPSMCAGYNAGMAMTDARYKLYLHQDMMAECMDLLPLLVSFFNAHPDVGLVGLAGSFDWEPHAIWWDAQQCYCNLDVWAHANGAQQSHGLVTGRMDAPWAPAAMLDGIFLMTQVDVPWREDVFRGWHFYDISACAEMRRAGHGIAILRQDTPWFAHCSGNIKVNMAYHY